MKTAIQSLTLKVITQARLDMKESLLVKVTKELPKRDKTCVKNILILAQGILLKEAVYLNRIKGIVGNITGKTSTKPNSHYKRLIRIFDEFSYDSLWLEILGFVFRLLRLKSDYLLLDGTSWERGNRQFHYLTLCVVYQGVAIPFYWQDLQKKGNSSIEERREMVEKPCSITTSGIRFCLPTGNILGKNGFVS